VAVISKTCQIENINLRLEIKGRIKKTVTSKKKKKKKRNDDKERQSNQTVSITILIIKMIG